MPVGKVITQWFVAKRGLAMGIALVGASGGGLVLVPLCGFLIAEFSWRLGYQVLAALSLFGMLPLVWFFVINTPEEKGLKPLGQNSPTKNHTPVTTEQEPKQDARDWTLRQALSTPTFWLLGVAFCLGLMAAGAVHAGRRHRSLTLSGEPRVLGAGAVRDALWTGVWRHDCAVAFDGRT